MSNDLVQARMLIRGEWVGSNAVIEVRNPANPNEVVGTIPQGTADHAAQAIAAAKNAQPSWATLSFVERAKVLSEALDALSDDVERRASLYARENGRILAETTVELRNISTVHRLTLLLAADLDARRIVPATNGYSLVKYIPYGVVVSIIPWNAPVTLAFLQIIPALLAGNAVVVKPPESCPLELIESLGILSGKLAAGLVNVVTGFPDEIGLVLTTHPHVAKIGFTGGIQTARRIMTNAAQSIKGVTVELGGNDPAIILDDVDLRDETVKRIARSVFISAGQVCMAIKRIYVPETKFAEFESAFREVIERYVVGDGLKSGITMGPVHNALGRDKAEAYIDDATKRGATVRRLGKVHDGEMFKRGYFVRPTVVTEIADDAPLVVEEQFCPVIPVMAYKTLGQAIERANNTHFGLCASVWSSRSEKALHIASQMQAGTVFVNTHGAASVNRRAPYGGIKQSGIGRRSSVEGIKEYLQIQTITVEGGAAP
jgi:acyl-CoA reductase-like NAD-dependent aldehyde dehydrogenase